MYYWDGQHWASTLSPDGRFRWNGSAWEAVPHAVYTPAYASPAPVREPTSWTRPLQIAIIVRYVATGLYAIVLPFLVSGYMSHVVQQSVAQQQRVYPPGQAPPAAFNDMMSSILVGSLWAGAILGLAITVVAVVGAIRRWTWAYYVILVLLGFTLLGTVFNLINIAAGGSLTARQPQPPEVTKVVSYVFEPVDAALFVWMLVALVRRGPWAMRRISC
jgi:hypothetical protein